MDEQPVDGISVTLSEEDLVRINRATLVAAVVRGTVHSVNNILQTIGGQAEMLGQRPEPPEDVARRAERISVSTVRAAAYMRELSATGRDLPAAPDRVEIRPCLDRVRALREYDLQRGRITFDVSYPDAPLPPVRIDLPALSMIVLNLVLNAEQALSGIPDARIVLTVAVEGHRVVVHLGDNGPGIPPDLRERVFDAFGSPRAAVPALGIGLHVSRYLAAQHGGSLVLCDTPGEAGARFRVDLPALA